MEETESFECRLITNYQALRCLYDFTDPDYRNQDVRDQAYSSLCESVGLEVTEKSIKKLKKKVSDLRSSYLRELLKEKNVTANGDVFQSKWRWFHLFDPFLRPFCANRARPSPKHPPNSFAMDLKTECSSSPRKKAKTTYLLPSDSFTATQVVSDRPRTEEEGDWAWCKSIFTELRKLSEENKMKLKLLVQQFILDARFSHGTTFQIEVQSPDQQAHIEMPK